MSNKGINNFSKNYNSLFFKFKKLSHSKADSSLLKKIKPKKDDSDGYIE